MNDLLREHYPLLVPGAEECGELEPAEVRAPFDGSVIASVARADQAAVERALSLAADLHADRDAWLPLAERIGILERTAALVGEQAELLAVEAAREGGKPLLDSRIEVARAVDSLRACAEALRVDAGEVIPMNLNAASSGRCAFTQLEPRGVVVAISAFNHPLNLIAHQVGPAVAAGCPVLVKPAQATPLSCLRLVSLLRRAGLPEEWCMPLLPEDHGLSSALAADPRVGFLSFIGSARVGWALRAGLAPGAGCALEHGGVAPVIVCADADLDDAVPKLVKGGFYHAGQVCVSVQRVYADARIADDLAARLAAAAGELIVGDPTLPETDVGPLIDPAEVDRVAEWVEAAVEAGAELICGGQRLSESCYAPTVLLDPPDDARVSTQEVFGPVICVYRSGDMDEAIARANALDVSFQAAVFTRALDRGLRAWRRLNASAVMVNDHTAFRVDWMPFAGLRHSGYGTGGIPYTLHDMQVRKMLVIRSPELE